MGEGWGEAEMGMRKMACGSAGKGVGRKGVQEKRVSGKLSERKGEEDWGAVSIGREHG